ncbi:DUF4192 domain-containing protein [Pseudarthrobacter sp. NIBRBAC000502772]|uniref:DUF4192 domain-containing protein n=1 Tax=Pseudarthrobacter sp. NIBRBAC000502772 TaxID=2590775 RepID=UPI0011303B9D|nr:DUF4192 domain-containing protein [Pseudarthrobacter sp. NIBRBAC000502772]QDG66589.1 DUF4192 domain-containing protein [Pseudarthrobacter sp. NIBRBAC000502772]
MKPSEHLTVRGPEDILGFIPHSLGYWPADSLVAMTLQGNRLGATLRLDLPGPETLADPRDYARTVRDYLLADENADAALLACFTNDGWMEPPGTYRGLLDALQMVLGAAGMPVRDAWYVGDAFWREAFCTDPSCCPSPGRSVQAIRDSMLNAEMVFRGSSVGPAPEDGAHPPPLLSGEDRAAVLASEATWAAQLDRRRGSREQFGQLMAQWEALLANEPGPLPVNNVAFLRASLRVPAWRDAVLVMAAAGQAAALAGAEMFGIFDVGCILAPVGPVLPGPIPSGLPAPGAGLAVREPAGTGAAGPRTRSMPGIPGYGEVLLGLDPVVPAWHTLNSLDNVLEQLSACGGQAGAAALTGRGWIAWCRGRGSYAAAYLGRALDEEPGYRLAELMLELVRRGTLCGWAARKEAAWRKFEPDAA